MIVESILSSGGTHSCEKFEGIYHIEENYYLLKSYFINDRKESKCQWHLAKTLDEGQTYVIVQRLGSSEIYDEDTSLPSFKSSALGFYKKI